MSGIQLLAVPNFSEGRSVRVVDALEATLGAQTRVLNRHSDPEHNRSVYTIAADADRARLVTACGARSTRST